jgi:hypothetical protein
MQPVNHVFPGKEPPALGPWADEVTKLLVSLTRRVEALEKEARADGLGERG